MNNKNKSKNTITKIQDQWQGLHKKAKRILKDDDISKPVYKSVILYTGLKDLDKAQVTH